MYQKFLTSANLKSILGFVMPSLTNYILRIILRFHATRLLQKMQQFDVYANLQIINEITIQYNSINSSFKNNEPYPLFIFIIYFPSKTMPPYFSKDKRHDRNQKDSVSIQKTTHFYSQFASTIFQSPCQPPIHQVRKMDPQLPIYQSEKN